MLRHLTAFLTILICTLQFTMADADEKTPSNTSTAQQKTSSEFQLKKEARKRIREILQERRSPSKVQKMASHAPSKLETKASSALTQISELGLTGEDIEKFPFFIDREKRLRVELKVVKGDAAVIKDLEKLGIAVTLNKVDKGTVVVAVPPDGLPEFIAALDTWPSVIRMQPVFRGMLNLASAESEGDIAIGAFDAREEFGVDGSGIKVCVISDGTDGADKSAAIGDLPQKKDGKADIETCPINKNKNDKEKENDKKNESEGTALLEIIHDLAPGAELGFCSGTSNGEDGFVDAIAWLADKAFDGEGCDIIVDDVAYLTEPYFQDGPVAQEVNRVVLGGVNKEKGKKRKEGVTYISAAGNGALNHYEHKFVKGFADAHDFGVASGGEPDILWVGNLSPYTSISAFAQWNEPFGAATSEYELLIFDEDGELAGSEKSKIFPSDTAMQGIEPFEEEFDPVRVAGIFNRTDISQKFALVVNRTSGKNHTLEITFITDGHFSVDPKYNVPSGSVWGHAAARFAISVGATGTYANKDPNDFTKTTPNPDLDIIEPFSSQGPSQIFFTPKGRQRHEKRNKPDIVAPDGVSITGAGGFPQGSIFFGTSAAAPHVAAVAALVMDAANQRVNPWIMKFLLKLTAEDRGKKGSDPVWGRGLIDAHKAVSVAKLLNGH